MTKSATESASLSGVIPLEPFPYVRPRFGKGRTYNKNSYTKKKQDCATLLRIQANRARFKPIEGPCSLRLCFFLKKSKRVESHLEKWPAKFPDIDNFCKGFSDSGSGILFKDDALIVQLIAAKAYCDKPRIEYHIEEIE